jgi:hypothetical protein
LVVEKLAMSCLKPKLENGKKPDLNDPKGDTSHLSRPWIWLTKQEVEDDDRTDPSRHLQVPPTVVQCAGGSTATLSCPTVYLWLLFGTLSEVLSNRQLHPPLGTNILL